MNNYEDSSKKFLFILIGFIALVCICGVLLFTFYKSFLTGVFSRDKPVEIEFKGSKVAPRVVDLETDFEEEGEDIFYDLTEPYAKVDVDERYVEDFVTSTHSLNYMTDYDREVATMNEQEAWTYVSNGRYTDYPSGSYASHETELKELQQETYTDVTVRVWTWAEPGNQDNLEKVTAEKTFAINSRVAESFEHIMQDIYNDPSCPIINLGDTGMGTWVLRGKNHNPNRSMSAHALGCCIDINPGTGSFYINGTAWYGNGYGQHVMTKQIWEQLPECQRKYNVLYDGCPIVEIFKAYGWYWGGDWSTTKDPMHLGYLGDGNAARSTAINNYNSSTWN